MRSLLLLAAACGASAPPPPPPEHHVPPPPAPLTCPDKPAPSYPDLRAAELLDPATIEALPSHPTGLTAGTMEPATAGYDDIHYQATGKAESFDVALRVVKNVAGCSSYKELLGAYPKAEPVPALGEHAFVAKDTSAYGVAILDHRGVFLLVLCGTDVCTTPAIAITLARTVYGRAR